MWPLQSLTTIGRSEIKKTWLLQMDHTPVVVQDTTASMITKNVHITGCHQKAKHLTTTAAQLAKVWNGK